jgi:hypothetical protein
MRPPEPLHTVARLFAAFCVALALVGPISFWPPASAEVVTWLVVWTAVCLGCATAIVRRARYAPARVWSLILLAGWSAVSAFRSVGSRDVSP